LGARVDHRSRILVLDEATSALDPESEAVVSANLERIASGRTWFSFRTAFVTRGCDQILVMDQGHIVDCGKHEVLVERCPIYRQLWKQQNRHLETPRPSAAPRLFSSERPNYERGAHPFSPGPVRIKTE